MSIPFKPENFAWVFNTKGKDYDKFYKEQEVLIQCKVECPLKSYRECKRCHHNKGRYKMH